jgi:hypothetical protein
MQSRRQFLTWMAGLVPAAVIVRRAHAASIAHLTAAPETLDALGRAVLPTDLGDAQIGRTVSAFRRWMDGYRENAELNHGYGNSRLRFTGPTPATRWTKQLDDLDGAARSSSGSAFSSLSVPQRQAIVRQALTTERGTGLSSSPDGANHVAAALLSFFYTSAAATDLCYEAKIGKNTCRQLGESSARPEALR